MEGLTLEGPSTEKIETEVVSHEFVVRETTEVVSAETTLDETPVPVKEDVSLTTTLTEISQLTVEETRGEFSVEERESVEETVEDKTLLKPRVEDEVPADIAADVVITQEEVPVEQELVLREQVNVFWVYDKIM